jgi:DNA mismatch repair protein MutL
MAKIHLLPQHEALKIAAGEVIERPAHAVKELLENAIDAQSTVITLYIEKAGKQLIRIVDNGCGMSAEDAHVCFLPHATSKLTTIEDLETIATFGFRGEALASIAAISSVTLFTKEHNKAPDELGIKIDYAQSMLKNVEPVACAQGTDIAIRDLFSNTPVRKKFLKQDETEWNAIQTTVYAYALSYPHLAIKLYHDNKLILNAPAVQSVRSRAMQLWDPSLGQQLVPLLDDAALTGEIESPSFKITGFISGHQFWRYNRSHIHFFVNNRWVRNNDLSKALLRGYLNVLPPDRFPAAFIFISIQSHHIDVNIHPKKEEIKFSRPGVVQGALALLVKKTLEDATSKTLGMHLAPIALQASPANDSISTSENISQTPTAPSIDALFEFDLPPGLLGQQKSLRPTYTYAAPQVSVVPPTHTQTTTLPPAALAKHHHIIGQLFKTYILVEQDDALVMIDQHAAHERILYEKLQKQFEPGQGTTLIFPEVVALGPDGVQKILEQAAFFEKQGIAIEAMGTHEIVVRSVPPTLKGPSLTELLHEAIKFIDEHQKIDRSLFGLKFNEYVHGQMACKSAVKAGDALTIQQMQQLLNDLHVCENRFICVHGRPTLWTLKQDQLEKHFQRA